MSGNGVYCTSNKFITSTFIIFITEKGVGGLNAIKEKGVGGLNAIKNKIFGKHAAKQSARYQYPTNVQAATNITMCYYLGDDIGESNFYLKISPPSMV